MILDRISNKWSMLILDRLREETVRFNQLRRDIDGISQKVLSQTLKHLERDGLLHREAFRITSYNVCYTKLLRIDFIQEQYLSMFKGKVKKENFQYSFDYIPEEARKTTQSIVFRFSA